MSEDTFPAAERDVFAQRIYANLLWHCALMRQEVRLFIAQFETLEFWNCWVTAVTAPTGALTGFPPLLWAAGICAPLSPAVRTYLSSTGMRSGLETLAELRIRIDELLIQVDSFDALNAEDARKQKAALESTYRSLQDSQQFPHWLPGFIKKRVRRDAVRLATLELQSTYGTGPWSPTSENGSAETNLPSARPRQWPPPAPGEVAPPSAYRPRPSARSKG